MVQIKRIINFFKEKGVNPVLKIENVNYRTILPLSQITCHLRYFSI